MSNKLGGGARDGHSIRSKQIEKGPGEPGAGNGAKATEAAGDILFAQNPHYVTGIGVYFSTVSL